MPIDHIVKQMEDHHLKALHRVAKVRARAFFRDPRAMMVLRRELESRGLA